MKPTTDIPRETADLKIRDIEARLATIARDQQDDPELAAAVQRGAELTAQRDALAIQRADRQRALDDHELAIETALVAGDGKVDDRAAVRLQDEIRDMSRRLATFDRAIDHTGRRLAECKQARVARTEASLRPIFVTLIAQLDAQVEAVAATERLLERAHQAAMGTLQGSSSELVNGYAGFAPEGRREQWRARVRAAGLFPAESRVA
jgi:hypothetical protein